MHVSFGVLFRPAAQLHKESHHMEDHTLAQSYIGQTQVHRHRIQAQIHTQMYKQKIALQAQHRWPHHDFQERRKRHSQGSTRRTPDLRLPLIGKEPVSVPMMLSPDFVSRCLSHSILNIRQSNALNCLCIVLSKSVDLRSDAHRSQAVFDTRIWMPGLL